MSQVLAYSTGEVFRRTSRVAIGACALGWLCGPMMWGLWILMPALQGIDPDWDSVSIPTLMAPIGLALGGCLGALVWVWVLKDRVSGFWVIAGGLSMALIWMCVLAMCMWSNMPY